MLDHNRRWRHLWQQAAASRAQPITRQPGILVTAASAAIRTLHSGGDAAVALKAGYTTRDEG